MIKLGITGGIASGKTTASNYLGTKKETYIFNADKESKIHLKSSGSLQKKLVDVFSTKILKNKKINLELLAENAFSNKTNHKILNGIMWPEIYFLMNHAYKKSIEQNKKVFIVDAALIYEANIDSFFDKVLLISTNQPKRIRRAIHRDNIPLESIQNRIHLQISEKEKKNLADLIIFNNGTIENLYKKLDKFYNNLF